MPKSKYPDEIELVGGKTVEDIDFNTDEQADAAKLIKEKWPIDFQDLEAIGDYSRTHYQNVYRRYFGPKGVGKTFNDIADEYGSVAEYFERRQRREEFCRDIIDDTGLEISGTLDEETMNDMIAVYIKGVRAGWEMRDELGENPRSLLDHVDESKGLA